MVIVSDQGMACLIPNCERSVKARGFCGAHAERIRRNGDPRAHIPIRSPESLERLWGHVDRSGPVSPFVGGRCWVWTARVHGAGYAYLSVGGKKVRVHRLTYELLVGPIPDGLELDHLCRVRHCVNPAHLEPVTHAVNMDRGEIRERQHEAMRAITHCPRGHAYDEANTYVNPRGERNCRACARDGWRNGGRRVPSSS